MNYVREANDVFLLQNGENVLIRKKSKKTIQNKFLVYKEKYGDNACDINTDSGVIINE